MKNKPPTGNHIVTILLHDYFHRGVFKPLVGEKQWSRFESRLDMNVDIALKLLDSFKIKGTFFTLGWIADKDPDIIKRIVSEGHEIANAGYWSRSIQEMTPEQFREDLRRSRKALESAGSNKIIGFRCAYRWMDKKHFWALRILKEEGYLYDASYKPPFIGLGEKSNHRYAFEYETGAGALLEFPTSTYSLFGINIPIAGGSYLRLLPHSIMYRCFSHWNKTIHAPFVLYFHPWELDPNQPVINSVGNIAKYRQYGNLGKMRWILPRYFENGVFQSVSQYLGIQLESGARVMEPSPAETPALVVNGPKGATIGKAENLSVIVPCFNEATSIPFLSRALEELGKEAAPAYKMQFIFVDDCSTDNTVEVLEKTFGGRNDCKIIKHEKNKGVAGALLTGVRHADSDIVCTIDADCSYDPLDLLKMAPLLEAAGADMITASPYHRDGFVVGVPPWRLFLSKSLSKMYHLVLNHKLATYTSCFRVGKRSTILKTTVQYGDFRGIIELLAKIDLQGGAILEYPTTLHSRIFGFSKMKVLKMIFGHLRLLFEIYLLRNKQLKKRESIKTRMPG